MIQNLINIFWKEDAEYLHEHCYSAFYTSISNRYMLNIIKFDEFLTKKYNPYKKDISISDILIDNYPKHIQEIKKLIII